MQKVYYLDMDHKITAMNLEFIRLPSTQDKFKTNSYQALVDELGGVESENKSAKIFLPETVKGTPRHMYAQYQQTLAIAIEYGSPDGFLTMTANPNWKEIVENLEGNETAQERTDLVVRVMWRKVNEMKERLYKRGYLQLSWT